MTISVALLWDVGAMLGEGPVWLPGEAALRFVDIKGGALHRFHPASGEGRSVAVGGQPSFILPHHDGGFLIGSGHGVHRWADDGADGTDGADGADAAGRPLTPPVATINQPAGNRTNDATVDAHGRLWLGTMDDGETAQTGALWCADAAGLHPMGGDAIVTNGPAITADGRWLYHVDSAARRIIRYAMGDGPDGGGRGAAPRVDDARLFVQFSPDDGYPDGVVLDGEDCLWVAMWDGWAVRRYAPDGRLMAHIPMPCARVTKIAFGGAGMTTAFVTTARIGIHPADRARQPHAGGLFAFDAGVAGRAVPPARWPV
ncbi:MAG: SMP-30/gluconolactonase/LRE family protein [Sphingopyxis sp.]